MSNKLILIVEDDEGVRTLVQRALSPLYETEAVDNGLAAIERLIEQPLPDLVICDVMIPGADGLAVVRAAKGDPRAKSIPFIFLTAKTTPRDVIQGIQAGARHYITKPFKLEDLLQKVQKILAP